MHLKLKGIIGHPYAIPIAAGVTGAAAGFVLGYSIAQRIVSKKIHAAADQMAEDMKALLDQIDESSTILERNQLSLDLGPGKLYKISDEGVTRFSLTDVESPQLDVITDKHGNSIEEPEPIQEYVVRSTLNDPADEGWDWDTELAARGPTDPYIIHRNEFFGDETEWDNQQQLTWYEVDGVLTNESESPIYNWIFMTGDLKFGHGSGEPDVVYIRNPRLHAEYEVTRLNQSFAIDVVADRISEQFEDQDIKHSARPGKFPLE